MRLLLDTHTFIWFVTDSPRLSTTAKAFIEDEYNEKLLSLASIWEMAIKHSVGKLSFELPFMVFVEQQMLQNSISLLSIQIDHLNVVANLPLHHRDPFDRLIIAQQRVPLRLSSARGRCSTVEQIPVVGIDAVFDSYSIQRLW